MTHSPGGSAARASDPTSNLEPTESYLEELAESGSGRDLDRYSLGSTWNVYRTDPNDPPIFTKNRAKLHRAIIDEYLLDSTDVGRDGSAAIITAGPPGAGKSTAVSTTLAGLEGHRRIDADDIKEKLLAQAVSDGIYDNLLSRVLPDGRLMLPNELATLVHDESVNLHDEIVRRSLRQNVNVVIEGTLQWEGLPDRYFGYFMARDYRRLLICDVEVDQKTALLHARNRWWDGRNDHYTTGVPLLGGRFTPRNAIDRTYTIPSSSICNANAVGFFNAPRASMFDDLELHVYEDGANSNPSKYHSKKGRVEGPRPEPLALRGADNEPGLTSR
jgi:hypothetical protein